MTDLETILSWFQTGDMPTEEEFRQTFSSFRHKNTKIPIEEVDRLESLLNSKINSHDYIKDGKIRADKIEALGLTELIEASEKDISEFAENSDKYEFQQNDFIAIPNEDGNFSLYLFKGGEKRDKSNYLSTGVSNSGEPLFLASPAYTITQANINNWNAPETDPVFTASPAHSITKADIDLWNQGGSGGDFIPMTGTPINEVMTGIYNHNNINFVNDNPQTSVKSDFILGNNFFGQRIDFIDGISKFTLQKNYSDLSIIDYNGNKITSLEMTQNDLALSFGEGSSNKRMEFGLNKVKMPNIPNAQGDTTFTRAIIQKEDGSIGYEPKTTPLTKVNTSKYNYTSGHNFENAIGSDGILNVLIGGLIQPKNRQIGGQENVFIGYNDYLSLENGRNNIAIGYFAGIDITNAYNNTFVGRRAGRGLQGAINCTLIGTNGDSYNDSGYIYPENLSNYTKIGSNYPALAPTDGGLNIANQIFGIDNNISIGEIIPTQKLDVNGGGRFRGLPNALYDPAFTRNIVQKADGTLGYIEESSDGGVWSFSDNGGNL